MLRNITIVMLLLKRKKIDRRDFNEIFETLTEWFRGDYSPRSHFLIQ